MSEIWREIADCDGMYEVSNEGNVRSWVDSRKNERTTPLVLKSVLATNGYLVVSIRGKMKYIHNLVANAFLPNPDNLPQINHKDENKRNNSASNLEWCTAQHNINWGSSLKRRAFTQRSCQPKSKPIEVIDFNGKSVKKCISIKDAERQTGVNRRSIQRSISLGRLFNGFSFKIATQQP